MKLAKYTLDFFRYKALTSAGDQTMTQSDNDNSDRTTAFSKRLTTHYVRISLVVTVRGSERVPDRSGLNWGQRAGRNANQAYLPISADDQRSGFFPGAGEAFSVECDDGFVLTLVRAQQNGKALETPNNNALLGEYFRRRLNVRLGNPVALRHLHEYGRTSVDIFRSRTEGYLLDFRP